MKVHAAVPDLSTRLCVGGAPGGWLSLEERCRAVGDGPTPVDPTHRDDPLLLYFTSGTVAYPKMVQHSQSYALGHIGTARFWHDLRPGDLHWTVTDTGWAKAAWGGLFGQMHERAAILNVALGHARCRHDLRHPRSPSRDLVLRTADALSTVGPRGLL